MNINEIKELINKSNFDLGDIEDFLEESEELEDIKIDFIENLDNDEHRWYIVETNVYKFSKNDVEIGKLAICEVGSIKSEYMNYEDCGFELQAMNVKEIMKKSYEIIEK